MNDTPEPARRRFLDAAVAVGERLCATARRRAESATWEVPAVSPGSEPRYVEAGGSVYDGTAGIARFLVSLGSVTGGRIFFETARGALRHALAFEEDATARGGYYYGTAGVAAVCAEMALATGEERWLDEARTLALKVAGGLEPSKKLDVVDGEAGSLLGLLQVFAATPEPKILGAARQLAETLVTEHRPEPVGVSWDTLRPAVLRNLLGFSHGVAGIALALFEIYRHTGDPRHFGLSSEALRYEDSFYDAVQGDWPDLRNAALASYLDEGRGKELVEALAADTFAPPSPGRMSAWCHGAPGIGLVRARLFAVTGQPRYWTALADAAASTRRDLLSPSPGNHSLCHGRLGKVECLLEMARSLGDETLVEAACQAAERVLVEGEAAGGAWRSGAPRGLPSPALMTGDAGVGLLFLRLAEPSLSGVLLPVPSRDAGREVTFGDERVAAAARESFFRHFPRTRRSLTSAGADPEEIAGEPVAELRRGVEARIAGLPPSLAGKAREALALESAASELLAGHLDFSQGYLRSLMRRPPEFLADEGTRVALAATSRLFRTEYDWEPLLRGEVELADLVPEACCYLLYRAADAYRIRRLDALATEMYTLLTEPISVRDLLERTIGYLVREEMVDPTEDDEVADVREKLRDTLRRAHATEMIDVVEPHDLEPEDITSELCTACGACCRIQIHIPGDETYLEFLREMLEEPLSTRYPEVRIDLGPGREPYIVLDLGDCRHLRRESTPAGHERFTCAIYERRPQTCRRFNCVTWWRLQRRRATGRTRSDEVIDRVATLKEQLDS